MDEEREIHDDHDDHKLQHDSAEHDEDEDTEDHDLDDHDDHDNDNDPDEEEIDHGSEEVDTEKDEVCSAILVPCVKCIEIEPFIDLCRMRTMKKTKVSTKINRTMMRIQKMLTMRKTTIRMMRTMRI